jgi:hypothetical protein
MVRHLARKFITWMDGMVSMKSLSRGAPLGRESVKDGPFVVASFLSVRVTLVRTAWATSSTVHSLSPVTSCGWALICSGIVFHSLCAQY